MEMAPHCIIIGYVIHFYLQKLSNASAAMKVIGGILFFVLLVYHAWGQIPTPNGLFKFGHDKKHTKDDKGDKVLDTTPFPLRPFKHEIGPIFLPDSLGGKKWYVLFFVGVIVDSTGRIRSMHPESMCFYYKATNKRVGWYRDSKKDAMLWGNATAFWERYIRWITETLYARLKFKRWEGPPPPGSVFLPVKAENYIPFSIQTK